MLQFMYKRAYKVLLNWGIIIQLGTIFTHNIIFEMCTHFTQRNNQEDVWIQCDYFSYEFELFVMIV